MKSRMLVGLLTVGLMTGGTGAVLAGNGNGNNGNGNGNGGGKYSPDLYETPPQGPPATQGSGQ